MTLNENDNAAGVGPDSPRSPDSSVLPAANQLFYNAFLTIINEKQRRGEEPECSQAEIENELNKMKGQFEEKHPGVPFPSRKAHFQTPLQRIKSDKANGDCKKIYWDQNKQVLRLASPTAGSASSSSSNQQQQQHDQQHPQQVTPTITTTFMPNAFLPTQASFVDASALHRSGATTTTTTTTDITTVPVISGSSGPNNNTNINFINYSANSNNNNNSTSGNNNNSSNNNNSKLSNNNNASSFTGVVQVSVGSASPAQSAPGGSVFMRNTKPSGPYYFILALETLRDNENMHKVKLDDIKRVLRDKFWSDIQRTHADSNFPKFCVTTPAGSVRKGERLLGLEVLYDKETDTYELPHNQTLAAAVIQTLSTGKNKRKQEDSGDDASNTTDSAKKKAKDQQQQPYQPPNIEPAIPTPLGQSSTPSKTSSPQSTGPQTPPMVAAPSVQRLPIQSGQVARLPIPPLHPPQGVRSAAPSTSPQQQQQQQQRPQGQQPKPAGAPTSAPTTTTTTGQQQQQQPLRPIQQPQSQSHPPQPQQQQVQSQPQPQPRPPPPVQQRPVASANSNTTTASYVPTSTVITGLPPQQQPPTLPERSQPMQSLLFNIETQVHSMMEQQRIRLESEHQKQLMERDLERMKQNQKHDEEIRRYRSTLSRLSTAMSTLLGAVVPANDRELRKLADDATSSIMRMTNNLHSNSSNNSGNEYDSSGAEFDQAIMSLASALRQRTQQQQQQQQHHTQTQQPQSQQPQQPQPQPQPPIQQQPQDDTSSNSSISNLSLLTNLSAATAAALNAAASTNANNNNTLNNSNNNGGASNSR